MKEVLKGSIGLIAAIGVPSSLAYGAFEFQVKRTGEKVLYIIEKMPETACSLSFQDEEAGLISIDINKTPESVEFSGEVPALNRTFRMLDKAPFGSPNEFSFVLDGEAFTSPVGRSYESVYRGIVKTAKAEIYQCVK